MTCEQCQNLLIDLTEGVIAPEVRAQVQSHLDHCPHCQSELSGIADLTRNLHSAGAAQRSASVPGPFAANVMQRVLHQPPAIIKWSAIMKFTLPISIAAAVATFVMVTLVWKDGSSRASAQDVLDDAAKAMQSVNNLHISARMRTLPAENPSFIAIDSDFVPIEIYKRVSAANKLQWLVEKPQRTIVMDGEFTRTWIEPTQAAIMYRGTNNGDLDWLAGLLRLGDTLKNEQQSARTHGDNLQLTEEMSPGDRKISVLTIEARAQSLDGNDWVKQHLIFTSSTKRVYRFDAQTKRFEGLQIWVHPKNQPDVLIFETTAVEYPDQIPDSAFTVKLPDGVQWQRLDIPSTQPVPDEVSKDRTPDQVARSFFQALASGDKDRVQQFFQIKMKFSDQMYDALKDLKIVSIGKPKPGFTKRQASVPYEIEMTDGETRKFELFLRNDNPDKRWYVDGGF